MPKKVVKEEIEEVKEVEEVKEEDFIPIEQIEKVEKPKKKLSEKQLQALAEGRKRGVEKLKQQGEITRKEQDVVKRVKEIRSKLKLRKLKI